MPTNSCMYFYTNSDIVRCARIGSDAVKRCRRGGLWVVRHHQSATAGSRRRLHITLWLIPYRRSYSIVLYVPTMMAYAMSLLLGAPGTSSLSCRGCVVRVCIWNVACWCNSVYCRAWYIPHTTSWSTHSQCGCATVHQRNDHPQGRRHPFQRAILQAQCSL